MLRSSPRLSARLTRIAPHVVDTVFLATGIALVLQLDLPVMRSPWLLAKLTALVAYVVLGMIAMAAQLTLLYSYLIKACFWISFPWLLP